MSKITHEQLVRTLAKAGSQIAYDIQPSEAHLMHMALGIAGEAGEIVDIIKKHIIYHKILDQNKVVEELGDLLFYVQGICQELGISLQEVLHLNIVKLTHRYGTTYSDEAAIARVDVK